MNEGKGTTKWHENRGGREAVGARKQKWMFMQRALNRGAKWRQSLYESGHRKHQPKAKECEVKQRLNQKSQGDERLSVLGESTSTKGVFVLLNDHTICSVFTQTVPGSLEETDAAPERWDIILHSHWLPVALYLQGESFRWDILSETRLSVALLNGGIYQLEASQVFNEHDRTNIAWNIDAPSRVITMTSRGTKWKAKDLIDCLANDLAALPPNVWGIQAAQIRLWGCRHDRLLGSSVFSLWWIRTWYFADSYKLLCPWQALNVLSMLF